MKLQCGVIAIILVGIFCLGGGIAIGKLTQPVTIVNNNHSTSTSISSANSYSVSGVISIKNNGIYGLTTVSIKGVTNITGLGISNGVTNYFTNRVEFK